LLFAGYRLKNDLVGYIIALSWWLTFFTSIISAGISERGIIHPWQLVGKLYRWDRIRSFSIENKRNTIMINFKIFRDLRQEYDKSDLDKIKKIAKKNKLNFLEKSYKNGKLFYEVLRYKDDYIGINYAYLEDELRTTSHSPIANDVLIKAFCSAV